MYCESWHALVLLNLGAGVRYLFYQETRYWSETCRGKLRKTNQCVPPGMATRVRPTCRLHFLHLCCLSFIIGMPSRSCILELRTSQCFVCNFFCMPKCMSQIAPKKTQCLGCLTRNFRNIQVISDSKSKVFGGSNLFQRLLMLRVVEVYLIAREVPGHPH